MKIGLLQLDGKLPNLALMKLSTYYKQQGDTVLLNRKGDINYASCIFTSTRRKAEALNLDVVGGPGWDLNVKLPPEVEQCKPDYELYGINYGLGRLTQGCPGDCPWCIVPTVEGHTVKTVAHIQDLINPKSNMVILLDSNILASLDFPEHAKEIIQNGVKVNFNQGLDIRYVNDFTANLLAKIKMERQIHFAWDKPEIEAHVEQGIKTLKKAGIKPYRLMFYVLCNYNTTFEQDYYRVIKLIEWGVDPYVMLYENGTPKLRAFARWCNRPWLRKKCKWEEYRDPRKHENEQSLLSYL